MSSRKASTTAGVLALALLCAAISAILWNQGILGDARDPSVHAFPRPDSSGWPRREVGAFDGSGESDPGTKDTSESQSGLGDHGGSSEPHAGPATSKSGSNSSPSQDQPIGYAMPWSTHGSDESPIRPVAVHDASGRLADIDWRKSILSVQITGLAVSTASVTAEVFLPADMLLMRASCGQEKGAWRASFELPDSFQPPVFVRFSTAGDHWLAMLTRAHMAGRTSMCTGATRRLFAAVDASEHSATATLPIIKCLADSGVPLSGVAAQHRLVADGEPVDHSLLALSDHNGSVDLGSCRVAGRVQESGLLLHVPGFVPAIVSPTELAMAAGREMKIVFRSREVITSASAELSPAEQALVISAWNNFSVPLALDLIPLSDEEVEIGLPALGRRFACVFPSFDLERAAESGWHFSRLEESLGLPALRGEDSDVIGRIDPLELLVWYRNQREYEPATGQWRFSLPCEGLYAVVLGLGYDAVGHVLPPLALLLDARSKAAPAFKVIR